MARPMLTAADESEARLALAAGWWPAARIAPLGAGHIHATWLVDPVGRDRERFVLQRISTTVFADPAGLMDKIARVVAHVGARAPGWVPALQHTRSGSWYHAQQDGACWRLWRYLPGLRTLQALTTPAQAESAGRAFGRFQQLLRDLPGDVPDPIPGFMRLEHYLGRLDAVREQTGAGLRAAGLPAASRHAEDPQSGDLAALLDLVDRRRGLAQAFTARDRLVHGDCKVDNLLFHPDRDEVACILDLDTVMRGHWAWDAGDLIRSAAADPAGFSLARFAAVVRGMRDAGGIAAAPESWALAPRYVTLMLGVRFLTDHLEGDRYFRVQRTGENLQRARAQFRLLQELERQEDAMITAVRAT